MSFLNTEKPPIVGKKYQYQGDRMSDFGSKEIENVELVEDHSDEEYHRFTFKKENGKRFKVTQLKGNYYYSGMPRLWDEGEYI